MNSGLLGIFYFSTCPSRSHTLLSLSVTRSFSMEVMPPPTSSSTPLVPTMVFSFYKFSTRHWLRSHQAPFSSSVALESVVSHLGTSVYINSDEASLASSLPTCFWSFFCHESTFFTRLEWLSCSISFYARRLLLRFWTCFTTFRIRLILSSRLLRRSLWCLSFFLLWAFL